MSRPRILFLAPKPPFPLTSGAAMRQFHLIRAYSTVASVELAFFCKDVQELSQARAGLAPYCERLHTFPVPPARRPGRLGPWQGLGRMMTRPMLARILESRELRHFVVDSAGSTDLIHVSRLHLVNAVEPLLTGQRQRPRLILDLDDVESVAKRRFWFSSGIGLVAVILGVLGVWGVAGSRRGLGALRTGDAGAVPTA